MPRKHRYVNRCNRESATWANLEPLPTPQLTHSEIQSKRLELAGEMVQLVLKDAVDLAGTERRTLKRLSEALQGLRLGGRW